MAAQTETRGNFDSSSMVKHLNDQVASLLSFSRGHQAMLPIVFSD
ncbi:hypothetical protein V1290_001909 [Bradyrhizobium sp. AZCC 1578]